VLTGESVVRASGAETIHRAGAHALYVPSGRKSVLDAMYTGCDRSVAPLHQVGGDVCVCVTRVC
jgi:hypothetical protein